MLRQANLIFRCEASPDNLDGNINEARRRRHERTDFIIKCFDPGTVWEKYGIRSDVVVSLSFVQQLSFHSNSSFIFSHLLMDFPVLISTRFYLLICCIKSSKELSRITW